MKVHQLRELLEKFPPEMDVVYTSYSDMALLGEKNVFEVEGVNHTAEGYVEWWHEYQKRDPKLKRTFLLIG